MSFSDSGDAGDDVPYVLFLFIQSSLYPNSTFFSVQYFYLAVSYIAMSYYLLHIIPYILILCLIDNKLLS